MDSKSFLHSKTIWGLVIVTAGTLLPRVGIQPLGEGSAEVLAELIVQAIGSILALYGRIKAVTKLKVVKD